jgi:hypothetical protein
MLRNIVAAVALAAASPLAAQDLSTVQPVAGSWAYGVTGTGTEARFLDASGSPQLWVQCTRATRRVGIARPATGASPFLTVWTSSLTRQVPASFNPATLRLTIDLAAFDPLLDAIVSSRGRVGYTVGAQPALVVPPWAEVSRVIEDCRV